MWTLLAALSPLRLQLSPVVNPALRQHEQSRRRLTVVVAPLSGFSEHAATASPAHAAPQQHCRSPTLRADSAKLLAS